MPNRRRDDDKVTDVPPFLLLEDLSEYTTGDVSEGLNEQQLNEVYY